MSLDRVSRDFIYRPIVCAVDAEGGWVHIRTSMLEGRTHVYFARLLRWAMHEADSPHRSDLLVRGTLAVGCWTQVELDSGSESRWFGGVAPHDFYADRWGMSEGCRCIVITECRGHSARVLRNAVRKLWNHWELDFAPAPVPPDWRQPPRWWVPENRTDRPPCPFYLPRDPIAEVASAPASDAASTPASDPVLKSEQKRTKPNSRDVTAGGGHVRARRAA